MVGESWSMWKTVAIDGQVVLRAAVQCADGLLRAKVTIRLALQ